MQEYDIMSDLNPSPYEFFSTAAGPDMTDLVGPPQGVLDVYADGSPLANEQTQAGANAGTGNGPGSILSSPDLKALAILALGVVMLHLHMKS